MSSVMTLHFYQNISYSNAQVYSEKKYILIVNISYEKINFNILVHIFYKKRYGRVQNNKHI